MRRAPILLIVAILLHGSAARADGCPFAQDQYARDTRQIQITTGFMERTMDLLSRMPAMEKDGFFMLESDAPREITRHEHAFYFDGFESHHVIDEDWLHARADSMRRLVCGDSPK